MFTSNYARARRLPADLIPVSISIKPPRWWKGRHYAPLCPTVEMLGMSAAEYDVLFDQILERLDPDQVYADLGDNAVILCFESPGVRCHRRRVAEFLEQHLRIVITEFGFERSACPAYRDLIEKPSRNKT